MLIDGYRETIDLPDENKADVLVVIDDNSGRSSLHRNEEHYDKPLDKSKRIIDV